MKKAKLLWGLATLVVAGFILVAADHIDAPSVAGGTSDIADFYGFEPSEGSDRTTFVVDLQSNVLPDLAYGEFDEDVLTEINIDIDGDLVEDHVIQAIPRDGRMYFFIGPVDQTGLNSEVMADSPLGDVEISTSTPIVETTEDGTKLFAGPRQDPYFFDFFQFNEVVGGMAPLGFSTPEEAEDTFDGANTLSIIVELPNTFCDPPTATNALGIPVYKTWVTTNRKQ
jgi:hypothetical protein